MRINDQSRTGIGSICVFKSRTFHVTENFVGGFLHVLLERESDTIMLFILKHFIKECKPLRFDVQTLNFRLDMFNFGPLVRNKPCLFTDKFWESDRLKMTASEKLVFVKLFGKIIADLVPVGDAHWDLYLCLRKVIDLAVADVTDETPEVLRVHMKDLLEHFRAINKDNYLKPKAHFLTHCPMIMSKSGSLKYLNCPRFESKHKKLKSSATATTSRRNLAKTVATKHKLNSAFRLKCNESIIPSKEFGSGQCQYYGRRKLLFFFETRCHFPFYKKMANAIAQAMSSTKAPDTLRWLYSSMSMILVLRASPKSK